MRPMAAPAELPMFQRPPRYRVLRIPAFRREGERVLVEDRETGVEQSWNTWTAEILDGLAAGEGYAALVDRIGKLWPARPREWHDATVRRFFYTLHRLKAIELLFDAPPAFADGRYVVKKELGRGGVGVAWLCHDTKTGQDLVVKRAWDYFAPLAKTDALMRAEVEVMRKLDHPGIAKPYDAFEEGGLLHLVREFAKGEELSRWRGKGVHPEPARRQLAREIADIVAHLHERGFVILDLRPANFFVDPESMKPMLIDVGHCKALDAEGKVDLGIPRTGKAHGSPGFAAPETFQGRATVRTDVWGFGRLYSFIATGQLPKHELSVADLLARMEQAGIPESERDIVLRCAADEEHDRPGSMRDAGKLLQG